MEDKPQTIAEYAGFQEKQLLAWNQLIKKETKYLLYGGAAAGGKSYFLRWAAFGMGMRMASLYNIPGIVIGLFCEDYPTLKDRQLTKIKKEFPAFMGKMIETKDEGHIFQAHEGYGGFKIFLRNLDDPSKYASTEFAAIFVDELTKNPLETFEDLRFRLRFPGVKNVKFVGATNPGSLGHAWVKKMWIEPDPDNLDPEQDSFLFVRSQVYDNKYIDKSYVIQLQSLPEKKRKAFLEGSWDVFEGQVFTEWNRSEHVIKPFTIPKEYRRYIAMDWGSNKPFSVGWFARNSEGRTYMYRELYMNSQGFENKYGKPLTARRLARIILAITKKAGEKYEYCVADPSMWNKILLGKEAADGRTEGESYAEVMMNAGLSMVQGDNDRMNGLGRFREALSTAPDGLPYFQVFETCYDTIRTVPALVYATNKVNIEDVDTDGEDHAYDMIRYLFMSRPSPTDVEPSREKTIIETDYQRRVRKMRQSEDLDGSDENFLQ